MKFESEIPYNTDLTQEMAELPVFCTMGQTTRSHYWVRQYEEQRCAGQSQDASLRLTQSADSEDGVNKV